MIQPTDNTFDFIPEDHQRIMISTAVTAITQLELWDFLKNFNERSFMLSEDERINQILKKIGELGYHGHSGGSFAVTMRHMEYIAKNGFENYKTTYSNM